MGEVKVTGEGMNWPKPPRRLPFFFIDYLDFCREQVVVGGSQIAADVPSRCRSHYPGIGHCLCVRIYQAGCVAEADRRLFGEEVLQTHRTGQ